MLLPLKQQDSDSRQKHVGEMGPGRVCKDVGMVGKIIKGDKGYFVREKSVKQR